MITLVLLEMQIHLPNTIISLFHRCKSMTEFKQAHVYLLIRGLLIPPPSLRPLISFAALHPSGDLNYALLLLFHIPPSHGTLFLFNTVIRGLARRCCPTGPSNAVLVFNRIHQSSLSPNNFTFTFVIQACASSQMLGLGQQFHSVIVKNSVREDVFVGNSILRFYSCCGRMDDAWRVFEESNKLDVVSWNSLISGYVRNGEISNALKLFNEMPERNTVSWNSLLSGLIKFGYLDDARSVFDEMPGKNIVSWAALISGCSQNGCPMEAVALFDEMVQFGFKPNDAVLVSVLSACSQLGALNHGIWIHTYIKKNHIKMDSILSAALIDIYAKCGSIDLAMQVFNSSLQKDVSNYTSAIYGLAMNGCGEESLQLFEKMKEEEIRPDCISYIAVLCACSHMGDVDEGYYYFNEMVTVQRIDAELEHYACMVDILGRAGLLEEAERFVMCMPKKPDNVVWGALLGACRIHNNLEMAQRVGNLLIESDRDHDGRYVLLSNIYTESNKVDYAEEVRRSMKRRKIKRIPGSSSIEINGVVHEFVAGDRLHEKTHEIYLAWEEIILKEIRKFGYTAVTNGVVFDVMEEEKEGLIGYHSEKLAVAFGLISTEPGTLLRIVKNIRICWDCHSAFKLFSIAFTRKVVLRDRRRFHHFEGGSCSCMDYW